MPSPTIALIGSGALACLFASRLHPVADVVLVGTWPAQMAVLAAEGLLVEELDGRVTHHPLAVRLPEQGCDLALVLVKSTQTAAAIPRIAASLAPHGRILTLQNGLGNREILAAQFGGERVAAGSTSVGATVLGPGRIRHAGHGPTYLPVGWEELASLLKQVGMETHLTADMDSILWGKLLINAGLNPLTALLRQPNGYLAENPLARELMYRAGEEAAAVATAAGVRLPEGDLRGRLLGVARATAGNRSSMLQDVDRGAPTEIEAITGQVVKFGRQYHIPTPINDLFWQLLGGQGNS
jgi:2-dehydropantoate 2-reductase